MKSISEANDDILKILSKFKKKSQTNRLIRYVVKESVDEGILLFNLLTKELVLLSQEEYANYTHLDYLKENWFLIPESTNEKELADLVKWILTAQKKKSQPITDYTIFTTTDCNARCFYCYELGRSRVPMSAETAEKVANYILNNYHGETVKITWFGGEPLFNKEAIDIICNKLRASDAQYSSFVVSNGYLFDEQTVKKAAGKWNVKKVQITLDGTEAVYNKTKAYIYEDTNPYQIVLENIGHLLDEEITVGIRLNMDLYNAEDLMKLVDDLAVRFRDRKGLSIYAHHIFKGNQAMAHSHTEEEWEKRDEVLRHLTERIQMYGLARKVGIPKKFRLNHCMADSGSAVTIGPKGDIGLCEHFSESEFIGHIDTDGFDQKVIASWKKTMPEIPECSTCFLYPDCTHLAKCPHGSLCFPQERNHNLRKIKYAMRNELNNFMINTQDETE